MMWRALPLFVVTSVCSACHGPSLPQDPEPVESESQEAAVAAQAEGGGESDEVEGEELHHGAGSHTVAGFFGGSDEPGDFEGFTFGLDYGYRIGDRWGLGVFAEGVTGIDRSFATGLYGFVNPVGELVLIAGPGVERNQESWGVIGRVGAAWEFPLDDHWTASPGVYYDFSEHTNLLIYGVSLGYSW